MSQNFDARNLNYVSDFLDIPRANLLESKLAVRCLQAMEKYGEKKWWYSLNERELAKHQLEEPVLLIPFLKFQLALEHTLKRPVRAEEMKYPCTALLEELGAVMV